MLLNSNRTLLLVLVAVFGLTLVIAFSRNGKSQLQNPSDVDDHKRLVEAIRRGGLREAARIKGSYVISKNAGWDAVFADTESLNSHSA